MMNGTRGRSWSRLLCPLLLVAAALLTAAAGRPGQAAARTPNILFILVDDMGWADIGCNGSTFYETPNIDRLAREGVRFTNAYAASPVCSPTRASILTGRSPARLKLTDFLKGRRSPPDSPLLPAEYADQLALEEVTIAEVLRGRGYATASIGKWHLGGEPFYPEKQGFDVNVAGTHHGTPASYHWPYQRPAWKIPLTGGQEGEYLTDRLTSEAISFMEQRRDRPFFLYLPYYSVHIPIQPRADKLAKYQRKLQEHPPAAGQQNNPHYAAMVETVDENVGRLLAALRRLGIEENTLVVFTSDNGGLSVKEGPHTPATTNAPLRAGKGYLYEGGIREPLLIRWPGVTKPGRVVDTPVTSTDFFPTFCEAAGLEAGTVNANGPLDGRSLLPLLRNPAASPTSQALYWHYPHFSNQGGRPGSAIREGDWKLVEFFEGSRVELYNLKQDPGEQRDLAAQEPDRVTALRAKLAAWRKAVDANMPRPRPAS